MSDEIYSKSLREETMPTDIVPIYRCPTCRKLYLSETTARACFDSNAPATFKPGDIVIIEQGYRWFSGDKEWVREFQGYAFHDEPTHEFYYVVTAVTYGNKRQSGYELHRPIYSVATMAMEHIGQGWTSDNHRPMRLAENPPAAVIEQARQFVGEIYLNII
jgi:hypothetical protein